MTGPPPDAPVADIRDAGDAVAAAGEGLEKAAAALYRDGPLKARPAFRDALFGVARPVLKDAFEALDGDVGAVESEGRTYRRAAR